MGIDTTDYADDLEVIHTKITTDKQDASKAWRQAKIRAVVCARSSYEDGITSLAELSDLVGAYHSTVAKDVKEMGLKKAYATKGKKQKQIYVMTTPTQMQDEYALLPPELVEQKVALLFWNHVIDAPFRKNSKGDRLIIRTEEMAAPLVHLWLTRLNWSEIYTCRLMTNSTIEIECMSDEDCEQVMARIALRDFDGYSKT